MRSSPKTALDGVEIPDDAFRRMVAAVDDYAIFMIAHDGRVLTWNRGAERINGYARDGIVGRHFSIFYPTVDVEAGKPARELEIAGREGRFEEEGWRVRKDGSRFWANVTVTALYDDDGRIFAFGKVTRDLTDRKRAADELVREQVARAKAEESARRTRFLAELTQALAAPLKVDETLEQIARVLAGEMAEYVIVDVRDADGEPSALACAHADPARTPLVVALRRAVPATGGDHPVSTVLRSGKPLLMTELGPADMEQISPAARAIMDELHPTSFMIVPLTSSATGRSFGTVSLVSCGPRRYQAPELALAMDMAHRSALAIENAQLYEAQRNAAARDEELRARFEAVLQQMPAGVLIADGSGRLLLANREAERLLGRHFSDGEEMMRALHERVFDADDNVVPADDVPLGVALRGETVTGIEERIQREDGSMLWIACNASPIRDADGRVVAGIAAFEDISDRRRAEDALQVLARAGEALVSSLDYQETLRNLGRVVVPALADWCTVHLPGADGGLDAIVVQGRTAELTHWAGELSRRYPPRPDQPYGPTQVMRTGEPLLLPSVSQDILRAAADDDEHLQAMLRADVSSAILVPLHAQGSVAGVLTLVGCGKRRYDEDDLALARELARRASIAVENARLYADVQRSERDAREAVRVRDEFISIASHELKTPLTALRMNTDSLQRLLGRVPGTDERLPRRVQMSLKQLDRLEALIQALLDVTRLSEGRLQLQPEEFDLAHLAREVAERFAEPLASSTLTVEAHEAVVGSWDRMRIDQVLTNLVSNAIKYGERKPIIVRVWLEPGRALVSVRDEGIGIAVADQARIFDRFERAVSARHFGGLGLGLWISRRMAEAMDGTLTVESEAGAGATFTLSLPRA